MQCLTGDALNSFIKRFPNFIPALTQRHKVVQKAMMEKKNAFYLKGLYRC